MKFEINRDAALRGYWVKGLAEINEKALQTYTLMREDQAIFLPDSLLREFAIWTKKPSSSSRIT